MQSLWVCFLLKNVVEMIIILSTVLFFQGCEKEGEEMNYDRVGEIYRSLVALVSSKSGKFKQVIDSKEFQLQGDTNPDQVSNYEEDFDEEDGTGERTAREEKKEVKEEEKKKKEVRDLFFFQPEVFLCLRNEVAGGIKFSGCLSVCSMTEALSFSTARSLRSN